LHPRQPILFTGKESPQRLVLVGRTVAIAYLEAKRCVLEGGEQLVEGVADK
jgi:hypothetical protein